MDMNSPAPPPPPNLDYQRIANAFAYALRPMIRAAAVRAGMVAAGTLIGAGIVFGVLCWLWVNVFSPLPSH